MEKPQRRYLRHLFAGALNNKKIVCLEIPDVYAFMQLELVSLLRAKVLPFLGRSFDF